MDIQMADLFMYRFAPVDQMPDWFSLYNATFSQYLVDNGKVGILIS